MGVVNKDNALYMAAGIDTSGLKKDAEEASNIIEEVGKESEKTGGRMSKSFESMTTTINATNITISTLEKTISSLNSKLDKSPIESKKIEELEVALQDLKLKYESVSKAAIENNKEVQSASEVAKTAASDYNSLTNSLQNAWKALGIGISVAGAKSFVNEIVKVRSEFQNTEAMFKVFLGSAEKAKVFMKDMEKYAFNNVFEFKDLTQQASQLLAFGTEVENVTSVIDKLSNIAAGVNQPLERFVELYNKAKSRNKLDATDIQQWSAMGDIITYLGEMLGKTNAEINTMVATGQIGFKEIDQLLTNLTSSGGKFYGMMEEKMKTLGDSVGLLEDSLTSMFNQLGEKSEDFLRGGILLANDLVENYETVGTVLMGLVATYGTYKAALIVINTLEKANTMILRQAVLEKQAAVLANTKLTSSEAYQIASKKLLTLHTINLTKALKTQATAMATNPAILFTAAIVGLGWSIYKLTTYESRLTKAHKEVAQFQAKVTTETRKESDALDKLFDSLKNTNEGTDERKKIVNELNNKYGDYLEGLDLEKASLKELEGIQKKANTELDKSIRLRLLSQQTDETKSKYNEDIEKKYKGFVDQATQMYGTEIGARIGVRLEEQIKESIKSGVLFDEKKFLSEIAGEFDNGEMGRGLITTNYNTLHSYLWTINREIGDMSNELSLTEIAAKATIDELNKLNDNPQKDPFDFIDKPRQIEKARKEVARLSQEIQDLNKGIKPSTVKDDEQFDFAKGIEVKSKELKDAENRLNLLLYGNSTSDLGKGESASEKARKQAQDIIDQNERLLLLEKRQGVERQRAEEDLQNKATQASIDAMSDGAAKTRAQLDHDNKLELESIERQKQDYINAYIQKEREAFEAQEELKSKQDKNYIKKTFDPKSIQIDTSAFDQIAKDIAKKQEDARLSSIDESWNEYFIKFGNYQEKRTAIIEKYNKAIEKELDGGKRATLTKEMQNALDDLDNAVKGSTTLMGQLFADTSQKSVREIQKIIDKVELLLKYLEAAKDENGNAVIDGKTVSRDEILGLGISDNALRNLESSAKEVESVRNAFDNLRGDLKSNSPFKLFESQIKDAAASIKNGNIGVGISGIGNATSQIMPQIKELGQNIASIFGDDELAEDIGHATDALDGLGQTAQGVGQIMSGDIVGGIMSAVSGITTLVGAVGELFGSSDQLTQATIDSYNRYMSTVDKLIAKQKELLESVSGTDAVVLANQARESVQRQIDATQKIANDWLSSKSGSKFSGGNWRGADKVISRYKKELQALGYDISSAQYDLITLSPEELEKIRNDLPKMWADFDSDFSEWLNTIIDLGTTMEEIAKKEKERLTGLSFDSLKNSFDDLLKSADTTFEDIGNSFEDHMRNAVLNFVKSKYLTDALKDWYDEFAKAYDDDELSKSEVEQLRKMYEEAYNKAQGMYDAALDVIGIDKEGEAQREGAKGGFMNASQDSVNEGIGTLYAIRQIEGDIRNINIDLRENSTKLNEMVLDMRAVVNDNNQILQDSLDYQSQIAANTYRTAEILDSIETYGLKLK